MNELQFDISYNDQSESYFQPVFSSFLFSHVLKILLIVFPQLAQLHTLTTNSVCQYNYSYYVYGLLLFSRLVTESRDCGSSLTGQHLRSIGITRATSISGSSNSKLFLVIKYIMSKNFTNYYYKLSSGHKEDRYS